MVERDLSNQFTELVRDIFRAHEFEVQDAQQLQDGRPDLIIRSQTGIVAVVEVKLYRSWIAPIGPVQQAAAIIEIVRQNLTTSKAILVVGNRITAASRAILKGQNPNLITYDMDTLTFLTADRPELGARLAEIFRQAFTFSEQPEPPSEISPVQIGDDLARPAVEEPPPRRPTPRHEGRDLIPFPHQNELVM